MNPSSAALHPTPASPAQVVPVIAVVGCDGSGKSTLSADLITHLGVTRPVEWCYLGQSSGNIGRAIKKLPLVGPPLRRYLARKAERAHSEQNKASGTATVLVIYLLSRWRAHKFRRMLSRTRAGVLVITDRYPQVETPGFYFDGPGLGAVLTSGRLAQRLVESERRLYATMSNHVPELVIRLTVDAATAHARKPDHRLEILREKVAALPNLTFNGARILELDGCRPYPEVLEAALETIRAAHNTSDQSRENVGTKN